MKVRTFVNFDKSKQAQSYKTRFIRVSGLHNGNVTLCKPPFLFLLPINVRDYKFIGTYSYLIDSSGFIYDYYYYSYACSYIRLFVLPNSSCDSLSRTISN